MEQELAQRVAALRQYLSPDGSIPSVIQELLDYLPDCEYELISFMVAKGAWSGFIPPPPANWQEGDGAVELGMILYWLNNPETISLSMFTPLEKLEIEGLLLIISAGLAPSQMTAQNSSYFNDHELIYGDGSVLSAETWATFDQGWLIAFFNLLESLLRDLWYYGENLPNNIPPVIQLQGATPGTVTVAVLGDCGTGDNTLQQVLQSITSKNPDYIIHVGDVYYSGTPLATSKNGSAYFFPGEEVNNFVNCWPASYKGRSFTLNSNHEMYSGANGYFDDALDASNKGANSLFNAQAGSSFFFLQLGDWLLIGLDTAYQSSSSNAFMDGTIGGATGMQATWIRKINRNPDKTILFTHHNGFAADCSSVATLWGEINGAFGRDPYAWYWGHVHNGIVYNRPTTIPPPPGQPQQPTFTTYTYARCLGHAAIPYGMVTGLAKKVLWNESTLQPPPSKQLSNGYAILTFSTSNNTVTQITEDFYDVSSSTSKFHNVIFSGQ